MEEVEAEAEEEEEEEEVFVVFLKALLGVTMLLLASSLPGRC